MVLKLKSSKKMAVPGGYSCLRLATTILVTSIILFVITPSTHPRALGTSKESCNTRAPLLRSRHCNDTATPKSFGKRRAPPPRKIWGMTGNSVITAKIPERVYIWPGPGLPKHQEDFDFSKGGCSISDAICGCTSKKSSKTGNDSGTQSVVGGNDTFPHALPWMFQITASPIMGINVRCTGFLISYYFALTIGHCIFSAIDYINITLGVFDLTKGEEEKSVQITIPRSHYFIHSDMSRLDYHNNIGFIQVSERVSQIFAIVHPNIKPACLATKRPNTYQRCFGAGWGTIDADNKTSPERLQWKRLRVFSGFDDKLFVYSVDEGKPSGPCGTDELGSPLMCTDDDGVTRVYGILEKMPDGCDSRKRYNYDFLTYIATLSHMDWINELTRQQFDKLRSQWRKQEWNDFYII